MNPWWPWKHDERAPQNNERAFDDRWVRVRLRFISIAVALFFGAVAARLVQLQVFPSPALTSLAERQFRMVARTAPYRRPILDRNLEELAVSVPSTSLYVRPKLVRGRLYTARILAQLLGGTSEKWLAKIRTDRPFVWLQRQLAIDAAETVMKRKLPGIFAEPESRRVYPNGNVAAATLGFVDVDGRGIAGLELTMDSRLLDRAQMVTMGRDGRGTPSYIDRKYASARVAKEAVVTTIDRRLQNAVEEELEEAVATTGAQAAMAIVIDPTTGEILALGQRPGFDPNDPTNSSPERWLNRPLSHFFEPGSVVKPLFAAEALERGILGPKSLIDGGNGRLEVGDRVLREASASHRFGILSLEQSLTVSSNIAAARVAQLLGAEGMSSAMERFGLAAKTGVELPGETTANPRNEAFWRNPVQLAVAGYGHGYQTTPMQMMAAYATIANGGFAIRPTLLRESSPAISGERRRVISEATARIIKRMLISVTEDPNGSGRAARVEGLHIAGKTGTAQKYEAKKGYASGKYFSSFIGMLPAEDPQLLVGVMVDEPKNGYYAAEVAAPVFRQIAERSFRILGRMAKTNLQAQAAQPAEVQAPVAVTEHAVPDVRGLSLREALRTLGGSFAKVQIDGTGFVVAQQPIAGTPPVGTLRLKLEPRGIAN